MTNPKHADELAEIIASAPPTPSHIAARLQEAGWVHPEDHRAEVRQAAMGGRIAAAANYPGVVTELLGYLSAMITDDRTLDPRELFEYVRDLKRRYVTEPVTAALAEPERDKEGGR